MIRGNYSLAAEFRKNEQKQQSKIQKRQKHQHKLEKLSSTDPIRLYRQIKALESIDTRSDSESKRLKSLKEDWAFIEKNKLHKQKIDSFLQSIQKEEAKKLELSRKLWGRQSIYFNPELNPLGKVPNYRNVSEELIRPLPNYTKPIKSKKLYEKDPLIDTLGITLPPGELPKFYKQAQNTNVDQEPHSQKEEPKSEEKGPNREEKEPFRVDLQSDSLDDDSDYSNKRQKFD